MRILAMQLDPVLGSMQDNADKALELIGIAMDSPTPPDLVVIPPFYLSGYPLKGLALSDTFRAELMRVQEDFAEAAPVPVLAATYVEACDPEIEGLVELEPAVCLLGGGGVEVLDWADDGFCDVLSVEVAGVPVDVVWGDISEVNGGELSGKAVIDLVDGTYDILRADLVTGEQLMQCMAVARDTGSWVVRVGCVGAQDSMVFPGASVVATPDGALAGDAILFDEALISVEFDPEGGMEAGWEASVEEIGDRDFGFSVRMDESGVDDEAADWNAIACAVSDYIGKNGFSDVVVGLSGGIDSTIVAAVAVDALGPEHVHGALMPSMYSSDASVDDALDLAGRLGIETLKIPINGPFDAFEAALAEPCGGEVEGLVRENLQARIRTVYLMALSNRYGWVLLNTGNKSEAAMGYSTLYGDTAGAYAPLGNVYKTRLYELAEWRNEQSEVIPANVLEKAPSAELRPNQTDQDSLPPYEILDGICTLYLEYGYAPDEIVEEGFEPEVVDKVLGLITANEYKRACEPMAPVIDGISLTEDRAWPVTNAFRDRTTG